MDFSIIQKSQLEGPNRLDAEYFQPQYLELEKSILQTDTLIKWEEIDGKFITGPFGSEFNVENYDENSQHRYVRGKDVKPFFLSTDDNVYIPEKDFVRLKKYSLEEDDILISVVGTLGNATVIDSSNLPAIFSSKSTTFRSRNINAYYLLAYLNSKYGQGLLLRCSRGQVQTGLNIVDLKTLPIYLPSTEKQDAVASLVKKSYDLLGQSKFRYVEAEDLLFEELGLKDFEVPEDLTWVVGYSEVEKENRVDAEYFQPKYEKIVSTIKSYSKGWDFLKNLTTLIGHPSNPPYARADSIDKTFIITQKHLSDYFPLDNFWEDKKALYTTNDFINKNKEFLLRENDILLYSVGAYIGKTNIYNSNTKATIGSFLTLVRAKQDIINPFYLLVFLNSEIGHLLTRRNSKGLAQQYIYPYDTKNIPVPKIDNGVQEEIGKFIKKGYEARKKSKELLEEAKRKVEEMIDKGSKN